MCNFMFRYLAHFTGIVVLDQAAHDEKVSQGRWFQVSPKGLKISAEDTKICRIAMKISYMTQKSHAFERRCAAVMDT